MASFAATSFYEFQVAFHLCDYSVYNFIKYYYVPLSFQGLMLVIITYLQHQNEEIEVRKGESFHECFYDFNNFCEKGIVWRSDADQILHPAV